MRGVTATAGIVPEWEDPRKKSSKSVGTSIMIVLALIVQIAIGSWGISRFLALGEPESSIKNAPQHIILYQTDDNGKIVRKWDFENAVVESTSRGLVFNIGESRVFLPQMEHYIYLENPSADIVKQMEEKE